MYKTTKMILVTASALLMTGTAVANERTNSNSYAAPTAQTEQADPVRYKVKRIVEAPTRKIRIVREALPGHKTATRTNTQGRFVIATDKSRDVMTVYKTVKHSKAMPNLFKNQGLVKFDIRGVSRKP